MGLQKPKSIEDEGRESRLEHDKVEIISCIGEQLPSHLDANPTGVALENSENTIFRSGFYY
jgi:hypothetical protein